MRRLALDVPGFSVEALQEHLYLLLSNLPHTPGSAQEDLEQAGREELEQWLDMLDEVISEIQDQP